MYIVHKVASRIDEVLLVTSQPSLRTKRNKLVPSKVTIFARRARRKRLPNRVELDKRDIDLHSLLCLVCDDCVETVDHCLVLCNELLLVWSKVFNWWSKGSCRMIDIGEIFDSVESESGNNFEKELWEGVIWITAYLVWKNRNAKVFRRKVLRGMGLFQEVQIRSFEWMKVRLKMKEVQWSQWVSQPKTVGNNRGVAND